MLEQRVREGRIEQRVRKGQTLDVASLERDSETFPRGLARADANCTSERSMPITVAGATRRAKSSVIVPGPQPQSRSRIPALSCGRKNAACVAARRCAMNVTALAVWPGV